ncbi:MAG: hypothetical protein F2667_14355 [Actinobacteria bacterium]|uniref:Unannotated protein n=1 Tax=freshwater metagenome TaxID=449393 RepID=A0A6J6SFF3_9ZZZZ|nr:hypothetical protein [Actinomycetota bacterium]
MTLLNLPTAATEPSTADPWARLRHRRHVLDLVIADPHISLREWMTREYVAEAFVDLDDLLRTLYLRWSTVLRGCLDAELETGGGATADLVVTAYQRAVNHSSGLRRVLDAAMVEPLLVSLVERDHARLAQALGLAASGRTASEAAAELTSMVGHVAYQEPRRSSRRERREREREVRRLTLLAEQRGRLGSTA